MSAQEIIAELPDLTQPELEELDAQLHELLCCSVPRFFVELVPN